MFNKFLLSFICIATFGLQGCASNQAFSNIGKYETGTHIDDAAMSTFHDKKTSKEAVIASVGRPDSRSTVGTREIWNYGYTKISSFGGNVSETTVFEFDKKGVLQEHYKTKGNAANGSNPLLKASGM